VRSFELVDYYMAQKRTGRCARAAAADGRSSGPRAADRALRLALMDYAAGRKAEAHAALDSVLAEQPSYPPARIVKGRLLLAEGKPREALDHALAAVAAAPREVRAHYLVAVAQLANGQGVEAEKTFNEVLRLNPRAVAAQVQLSRLQLSRGETEPALEAAKSAARTAPRDPGARITLARSLVAVRDLPRAKEERSIASSRTSRARPTSTRSMARSPSSAMTRPRRGVRSIARWICSPGRRRRSRV
jgi:Flp pilus assembly protein TadD